MVSLILLPAESAAMTRSETGPADLSLNTARNVPGPVPVTATDRQVFPPSCDTCTVALLTAAARGQLQVRGGEVQDLLTGWGGLIQPQPGYRVRERHHRLDHAGLGGRADPPAGSTAPACLAEGQVHTVRLDVASP